jgi:hypothetical protein
LGIVVASKTTISGLAPPAGSGPSFIDERSTPSDPGLVSEPTPDSERKLHRFVIVAGLLAVVAVGLIAGISDVTATTATAIVGTVVGVVFTAVLASFQADVLAAERGGVTRAREDQQALLEDITKVQGVPKLGELLEFNERQMQVYQQLSLAQARSSYRRSQFAFLVGLLLIVGAVAASFSPDTTTKLAAGGIAGLGGAFSAYLSATYLRVYGRTLDQLNFYYRQPLVNSYLLTAERLVTDMVGESRAEAYNHLVRQVLACASVPPPDEPDAIGVSDGRIRQKRKRQRARPVDPSR